jgi:hypothetical protein
MNKTQQKIIERMTNMHGQGSYKLGWHLTNGILTLHNLNDGEQAHKLAEKYPNRFKVTQVSFRLVKIEFINVTAKG